MAIDPVERFEQKAIPEPNSGCWLWTGMLAHGYGRFRHGQRLVYAHRFSHEHYKGPIPNGMEVDHLCRVTSCVNPDHLEAVTPLENIRRRYFLITHCRHGHEFTHENTYYNQNHRKCRACNTERQRRKSKSLI